ncbi:MAG: type II toxin-antitoxin system VapC family toxin [bacterium]
MTSPMLLVDTNIVSYLMRGGELARLYAPHLQKRFPAIAFITVGELYYGVEKKRWGASKRQQLEMTLRHFVEIPSDRETAQCYGRLVAGRERLGHPISSADAWIAACAIRYRLPLVTHNAPDFLDIPELQIITEYKTA